MTANTDFDPDKIMNTIQKLQLQVEQTQQQQQEFQHQLLYIQNNNPFAADILLDAELRKPQRDAVLALQKYNWTNSDRRVLLDIHTGCGKSGILACAPFTLPQRPRHVLYIAPDVNIRNQLFDTLDHIRQPFIRQRKVIAAHHPLPTVAPNTAPFDPRISSQFSITVINIQRLQQISQICTGGEKLFDLILIDEAHHYPARSWDNVVNFFNSAKCIFVSATPFREDQWILPPPISRFTYADALQIPRLVKDFRDHFISVPPKIDTQGNIQIAEISNISAPNVTMNYQTALQQKYKSKFRNRVSHTQAFINSVVEEVKNVLDQFPNDGVFRQALAICRGSQLPNIVQQSFINIGLTCTIINMDQIGYENNIKNFKNGQYRVAIVNKMLSEGYDNPQIAVAVIFSHIVSLKKFMQFVGRAVRGLPDVEDQRGYIITHELLGQETLFQAYLTNQGVDPDEDIHENENEQGND
ncbi:hypothetical protein I4U23_005165 [Adineta vaga]|nr:hypothetical protein I4U23_005165 [Adineta vaga]